MLRNFVYYAPIERVWPALTDTTQMRTWYFPQLRRFEPTVGYRFQFDNPGAVYQKEWVVTKLTITRTGLESFPDDPHFSRS